MALAFDDQTREIVSKGVTELVDLMGRIDPTIPTDSATWGLHARIDRAVADYIAAQAGRDHQAAASVAEMDPYTFLIVTATMRRRSRLTPLVAMSYSRPFCPPFEALEDALLKPLAAIAASDETPDMRNYRVQAVLADWIPEITQDLGDFFRDVDVKGIG